MNPLQNAARDVITRGAILTVWNSPPHDHLVGEWDWNQDNQAFWFTAHGDRLDDGHLLHFDTVRQVDRERIEFFRDGSLVARLASIEVAAVDDRDDFAIAFSIWRQVEPCLRPLIDRSRAHLES